MLYTLDASVRRIGAGRVIVGGSPLSIFRLTDGGAAVIDAIEQHRSVEPNALVDRLLDAGAIHPRPAEDDAPAGPLGELVTVVIPAYAVTDVVLRTLVAACAGPAGDRPRIVIVDDASPIPIPQVPGAEVLRRESNGGPAAARQTGLDAVRTPLVAFVDTDVTPPSGWIRALLPQLGDPRVALVAPRIASTPGVSSIARYEATRSPLDLGSAPARVRAGTRVSYVPSAALLGRVGAIRAAGAFDVRMRVGEDVDLVWRLDEAGHRVRFDPTVVVEHVPRPTLTRWMHQRYGYGRSAGPLASRHPGNLAPVRVSGWSAAAWALAVAGRPLAGGSIAAATTALLARKLRRIPDGPREALRLAGLGHLYAGRSLASGITRAWWPVALPAALVSRRARRAVLLAALWPATADWVRTRPDLALPTYVGMRVLDDASYGVGLIGGALHERSLDAVTPDFTSWPNTRRPRRR